MFNIGNKDLRGLGGVAKKWATTPRPPAPHKTPPKKKKD